MKLRLPKLIKEKSHHIMDIGNQKAILCAISTLDNIIYNWEWYYKWVQEMIDWNKNEV